MLQQLQVWNPADSEEEVLVMVCRTGLNTTMGGMIRGLLAPIKAFREKEPFIQDVVRLYCFALMIHLLLLVPYLLKAHQRSQSAHEVILKLCETLTFAAPPALPSLLMLVGFVARRRSKKDGLQLMFPEILKRGAACEVVCFDKTGTLTHSAANLHGTLPVDKGNFQSLQQNALRWSNRLKQAFAVCNSLNMVSKTAVAGVDMEQTLFKLVEASFLGRETVVLPRRPDACSTADKVKLCIQRQLEFSSQTLRSGVVVISTDAPKGSALLFLRGAPAVIKSLVTPTSVPPDFDQVVDEYSSKSFRLLAAAVGVIPAVHKLDLPRMTQQQAEASASCIELIALVVLTNSIRGDSKDTITQLQEGGGIRTMMITGDYHHTAIAVAKGVGMVQPGSEVVVIDTIGEPKLRGGASQESLLQQQEGQQMLFAAFGKADADYAFQPELLGSQPSGKHQHGDFQKADLDYAFAPQLQEGKSQGKHQHWEDDQTMLEPVYSNRQSIQDTAAQSGVVGHRQQGGSALPSDGSMQAQSACQLQMPEQAALSHQVAISRQQSAVSWQQSAVSSQLSAVSQHHHRKLPRLTGAEKMRLKLSGQLQIPAEALSQQQQHEHQHAVGLETIQSCSSVTAVNLLHAAVADAPSLDQHHIPQSADQAPITAVSRMKSWFTAMLDTFAEDESAPQQKQHEEGTALQQVSVRESSLPVLSKLKSRLSGLLQMHAEEEASQHQLGEGRMQKDARMRSTLTGHHQMPILDTPLSDPLSMFSPRGRPAHPLSIFIPPAAPEPSWEGLRFLTAGHQTLEASQALTALAEGQMRCAVTGDAFEHLLQHHDLSLLELVIRNVAVFSRMQPQQKGQVMDLLGIQGIHQLFNGRPRHIVGLGMTTLFCGDGINDLVALASADVGMAIGATDASVAAAVCTSQASVAGVCSFIRISKGAHAVLTSLFKYLVVYLCIVAEANATAFFLDGSSMSNIQMQAIDVQAMAMCLAACWVPPLKQLNPHKPSPGVCTFVGLTLLICMASLLQAGHMANAVFLCTRPWYRGGNGTADVNPVNSMEWMEADIHLLAPFVSLAMDTRNFCQPLYRVKVVVLLTIVFVTLAYVAVLARSSHNLFNLYNFEQSFRLELAGMWLAQVVTYWVSIRGMRYLLERRQHRRLHPVAN
ncbi:hypothetical protein WJX77_002108 [Trebouxia sp. C0004]